MSHQIAKQVHEKFKVFTGPLAADHTIGKLASEVAEFAATAKIAAKSIGVVHLESAHQLVMTLGYRNDEDPYPIKLHCVPLGKIDVKGHDFSALEKAMAAAAGKYRNLICHELYLAGPQDFMMVLMTHEAV